MGFRRFAAFGPVLLANPYFLYNIRVTLKYTIPNITYSTSLSTFYPKRVDPDDPIVTRISQDPKLMASIQEFSEILKSKGIDLGKRQMPSMLQMAKLATDGQHISKENEEEIVEGLEGLIGNTPLMKIKSLSKATGCEILGKAE
ncbi:4190_t:CDS:2, partial [Entrophospora sp. SA101]